MTPADRPLLTLIQPPCPCPTYPRVPFPFEPLSLLTLAGLTPSDRFRVRIIDGAFLDSIDGTIDRESALVGITVVNVTAPAAFAIAREYRRHRIPVILGGPRVTLDPDGAASHADSVVVGEVENGWVQILDDFAAGALKPRYRFAPPDPILSRPDRSVVADHRRRYPIIAAVQTTRGCPNGCEFCAACACHGNRPRHRPVQDVVDEIRDLRVRHGRRTIGFTDDNIVGDKEYARQLFEALTPLRIRWAAQMCLDAARDPALFDRMVESGCFLAFVGLETVSRETHAGLTKPYAWEERLDLLERFRARDIMLIASFTIGHDADDEGVYDRTLAFCARHRIEFPLFVPLMAEPGLPLYERMRREGRLADPGPPGARTGLPGMGFVPRGLSLPDVGGRVLEMYRRFYTFRRLAGRLAGAALSLSPTRFVCHLGMSLYVARHLRALRRHGEGR